MDREETIIPSDKMSSSAKMSFQYLHPELIQKAPLGMNLKSILADFRGLLREYIDTSPQNIEILSLWAIGTHFHSKFETFPILQLYAQKRSGKTRTLKLLSALSYGSDGSVSTSPTETLLFRHKEGALFFDEMESISSKERGAFRETLNAVYKKGNKIIKYREVKGENGREYKEEVFYPYYPVGLANINGLNDVLGDRAVQVILQRSNNKTKTRLIEDFSTNPKVLYLKKRLDAIEKDIPQELFSKWNDYIRGFPFEDKELKPLFESISKTNIYGRHLEIFFPMFIVAYLCEDIDNFLSTAQKFVEGREEEDALADIDELLKRYVYSIREESFMSVSTILEGFRLSIENPEDWINSKWLGRALKRLGLIKKQRLVNGRSQVLLNINSTNSTNPINTTNTTNSTKPVELVDNVGFVEEKMDYITPLKEEVMSK